MPSPPVARRSLLSLPRSLRYGLLGFGLAGALSCGNGGGGGDAGRDLLVREDVQVQDLGVGDRPVDRATDPATDLATDLASDALPPPDRAMVDARSPDGACSEYNACITDDGQGDHSCEPFFVCAGESCAPGCRACVGGSPRYCFPESRDAGPEQCDPFEVCKESDCQPGCVGLA